MLARCVAGFASPPTLARSNWFSRSHLTGRRRTSRRGRLRAPDDLCRSGDAKDLDKTGHLVEQLSASVVLAPFSQDDHGDKARSDLLNPAGVFQDAICCGQQRPILTLPGRPSCSRERRRSSAGRSVSSKPARRPCSRPWNGAKSSSGDPSREGPMVRIHLPPAASHTNLIFDAQADQERWLRGTGCFRRYLCAPDSARNHHNAPPASGR